MQIDLANETDFDGFRTAARKLLAEQLDPAAVNWGVKGRAAQSLFDDPDDRPAATANSDAARSGGSGNSSQAITVPQAFVSLCAQVVLHRDPQRFDLMYQLAWRLQREPALRNDPLDAHWLQAKTMAHAVQRDQHKMKAFVRFRELPRDAGMAPLHVAWFEPEHHIVEAVAPFFMRRFTAMRWAILTPERCVHWDGQDLQFSEGASRDQAPPADAGEALWLTYYRSIFNPARLKLSAMTREMPRRYWHNLPEARLISGLAAQAPAASVAMIERGATLPRRSAQRLPAVAVVVDRKLPPLVAEKASPAHREAALNATRDAAARCRECPLGALATQTVWGEGPVDASLMIVGEQPGDQEDLCGKPFVGPSGALLDRALVQLKWQRGHIYITNGVKHFKYEPRGRRRMHKTPAQREADACAHWLDSEIALVRPQAIVALGATAARQLLGRPVAVTRERGRWLRRADGLPVLVTLHPSALLRGDPAQLEQAFSDWLGDLALASAAHLDGVESLTAADLAGSLPRQHFSPAHHDKR